MTCSICNHPKRLDIEAELLVHQWGSEGFSIQEIAQKFNVNERDLQVHALMHIPAAVVTGDTSSLSQKINMTEADLLRQTASQYHITVTKVNATINKMLNSGDAAALRGITKPLVDLYLGAGAEVRGAVETLVKMNQAVNGEDNSGLSAIATLITTIRGEDK